MKLIFALFASMFLASVCFRVEEVGFANMSTVPDKWTEEDCEALLLKIFQGKSEETKKKTMLIIKTALFAAKGLDDVAEMVHAGKQAMELVEVAQTGAKDAGGMLSVKKTGSLFTGDLKFGGSTFGYTLNAEGKLEMNPINAAAKAVGNGASAVSAGCFVIVGLAFLADCATGGADLFAGTATALSTVGAVGFGASVVGLSAGVTEYLSGDDTTGMDNTLNEKCTDHLKASVLKAPALAESREKVTIVLDGIGAFSKRRS